MFGQHVPEGPGPDVENILVIGNYLVESGGIILRLQKLPGEVLLSILQSHGMHNRSMDRYVYQVNVRGPVGVPFPCGSSRGQEIPKERKV
ncbi:hypothetical protein B6U90_04790 [Thermoplasmatales archaeon ex4484_6]|nr:MAG: hypothetical protein B6U90_04790 [Thermoplasmatales archaeon ex4484_6]